VIKLRRLLFRLGNVDFVKKKFNEQLNEVLNCNDDYDDE
jgi:hypothetical protein